MANTNFDHQIYKAIAQLIEGGEDMELNAFIDGGRGDLYLEAPNGHRLCIAHDSVTYCVGDWVHGARTEITSAPSTPAKTNLERIAHIAAVSPEVALSIINAIHAVSCDCEMGEATAEELYKAGCDPITAQYLATGELPG